MRPEYTEKKIARLREVYAEALRVEIAEHPDKYPWYPRKSIETLVETFVDAIAETGIATVVIDSGGWRRASKEVGIPNTYRTWEAWLQSDE